MFATMKTMRGLIVALSMAVIGMMLPHSLFAQNQRTWEIEVDGIPVWVTIVSPQESESQGCDQWWECGNMTSDAYLFAVGRPENVRLILDFETDSDDRLWAKIYVSDGEGGPIRYQITNSGLSLAPDDQWPYLTIEALDTRWVSAAGPSYNLKIDVDGAYNGGEYGNPDSVTNGVTDFIIQIRASNKEEPLWQTVSVVNDPFTPAQRGWPRFVSWMRLPEAPPFRIAEPFMPSFPLFGLGLSNAHWFEENPLPIFFDLDLMTINLQPFVTFQTGGSFAVNSITPPPYVNFESPFAFYSFNPGTRQSHLVVRSEYVSGEGSPASSLTPRLRVRYSWKTDDDLYWRYGLQLGDFYGYETSTTFGDTEVFVPAPDEWPEWVMSKSWRAVTFIEPMAGYSGSEGIYHYVALEPNDWLWLAGVSSSNSDSASIPLLQETTDLTNWSNRTIPAGFRGEYMFAHDESPELYFSPVDGLLHLSGAEGGIWYLGDRVLLRSTDLDGDGVSDGWTREIVPLDLDEQTELQRAVPGKVIDLLYDIGNYLLQASDGAVTIVQADHKQVEFKISPPTDKESWESFRIRLRPYEDQRRDPTDLRSWLGAFSGPRSEIAGASVANVRITDDGFRFELALEPGMQVAGTDLLGLGDLPAGQYVVENRDGVFHVAPMAPAQLTIDVQPPAVSGVTQITVGNSGTADATDLELIVEVMAGDKVVVELSREPVDARAGEMARQLVTIPSNMRAGYYLSARLEDSVGETVVVSRPLSLAGPAAEHTGEFTLSRVPVLIPVLGSFSVLLALAALLAVMRRGRQFDI